MLGPAEAVSPEVTDQIGGQILQGTGAGWKRTQVKGTTQQYLASIVESCDDAIIGKTLEGIVVSWNGGAERLYGYTAEEMIGTSISKLIPTYRPNELPDIRERIKGGEHVASYETVRRRKDGTLVDISLTVSPIRDATGGIIGASAIARDNSRKKLEENERLLLIQELTEALSQAAEFKPGTVQK